MGAKTVKYAVVGSGIAGMGAAWLLSRRHDVMLFEAEKRLGGHANTVDVGTPEGVTPIDTGFIVYNTACYPNLIGLFDYLGVPTAETGMGFSVSLDHGAYEYSGSGLAGLFGQKRNLVRPSHWRLISEIMRFFKETNALDLATLSPDLKLGEWLTANRYSKFFIHAHIVPMGAAIWSTPADDMLDFPFAAFVRFFANHGLLQAYGRPAWRTVKGGSREYISRLKRDMPARLALGEPVTQVEGNDKNVKVTTRSGTVETFDAVIVACHADEALKISATADAQTRALLQSFRYQPNLAYLHSDSSFMPRRRNVWASWNYLGSARELDGETAQDVSLTYWMNRLQPLETKTNYFVTLNPTRALPDHHIIGRFDYDHPVFDAAALAAQKLIWSIQGRNRIWYAGSYLGYGFHEDGLEAGLAAAEDLSATASQSDGHVKRPWRHDERHSRIARRDTERPIRVKVVA